MATEHQSISDEELARRTQAGSLSDFEELVSRYETRIFRFVVNFCRNATDAQEVTQEVFVTAFQKIAQFDSTRTFPAWLFAIARRKCIDHHRSKRPLGQDELPEMTDVDDPSAQLERREAEQNLWKFARGVLNDLQFQVLWLRYAEEMSVGEIARVLRRTETHVKVLLFRARNVLAREWNTQPANERDAGSEGIFSCDVRVSEFAMRNRSNPGRFAQEM